MASFVKKHTANYYAPNFEKVGSILLSACPFVCQFVCPSVRSKKIKARVLKGGRALSPFFWPPSEAEI